MFLALALGVLGGLLLPASNHTGLSYRIPRVLNWIEAGQWHWIYAPNIRMNTRACGIGMAFRPVLPVVQIRSRLVPAEFYSPPAAAGLLFSMLTRLGVRARVAWSWMWVFPTGYVPLQAGRCRQ